MYSLSIPLLVRSKISKWAQNASCWKGTFHGKSVGNNLLLAHPVRRVRLHSRLLMNPEGNLGLEVSPHSLEIGDIYKSLAHLPAGHFDFSGHSAILAKYCTSRRKERRGSLCDISS